METNILHVDMNSFYVSVELLERPDLLSCPVVVGGDERLRRGVVLAKNEIAKGQGVKTAMSIYEARRLVPDLVVLPPRFPRYTLYSQRARELYERFAARVEPFGLDECWLKVAPGEKGLETANAVRQAVKEELGLTVSIGVSFTKVFAKLGSDYRKPDALTLITRDNFQELLWPLPVERLLYVGRVTGDRLRSIGIDTIGKLAALEPIVLERLLGRPGRQLWEEANGQGDTDVAHSDEPRALRSVGNSTTLARDATTHGEIVGVLRWLADNVARRAGEAGVLGRTVQIMVKDTNFVSRTRQTQLVDATADERTLLVTAIALFDRHFSFQPPIRALGLTLSDLVSADDPVQLRFEDLAGLQERGRVQEVVSDLKERFGDVIRFGRQEEEEEKSSS